YEKCLVCWRIGVCILFSCCACFIVYLWVCIFFIGIFIVCYISSHVWLFSKQVGGCEPGSNTINSFTGCCISNRNVWAYVTSNKSCNHSIIYSVFLTHSYAPSFWYA